MSTSSYREAQLEELVRPGEAPKHVAIIMDGNGRWAKRRGMPRIAGHRAGVESVRRIVSRCVEEGVEVLTLFAFSSENWSRPQKEVGLLMDLFFTALKQEVKKLSRNNVRLRVIGDTSAFAPKLQKRIAEAEAITQDNDGLELVVAANYGGRWDVLQAARKMYKEVAEGRLREDEVNEDNLSRFLCMADLPEPDLFIRTGGEQRISNFLLWQLAYSELYFTDILWPDFHEGAFNAALESFSSRQRRFGRTGEQIEKVAGA